MLSRLHLVLVSLAFTLIAFGSFNCRPAANGSKPPATSSAPSVSREAALAFAGLHAGFVLLDETEAARLAAVADTKDPAVAKAALPKAERRNAQLHRLRDALVLARSWLSGERSEADGRQALRDAADALGLILDELRADGLAVPREAAAGLAAARALL